MRPIPRLVLVGLLISVLGGCSAEPSKPHKPLASPDSPASPKPTPWLPADAAFAAVSGTYRTAGGETWVVDLQGLLVNLQSGAARAMVPESVRYRFAIGPTMGETDPAQGEVTFEVKGVKAGERVILAPGGKVQDGTAVAPLKK